MRSLDRGKVLLVFLWSLRFLPVWTLTMQSLSLSSTLKAGDTLVSQPLGRFELGILPFQNVYYLCIRYAAPIEQVVTWVANRDTPLLSSDSYLLLSSPNGILQLFDPATDPNTPSWSSIMSANAGPAYSAQLLDKGNLVLVDNKGKQLWDSFKDSPSTDTLLPGQYFYKTDNRNLISWLTKDNPASGPNGTYTFGWGTRGNVSILQLAWTSPKPFMNWTGGAYVPAPLKDEASPRMYSNVDFVYIHETLGHLYIPSSPPSTPAPTAILKGGDDLSATTLKRITIDIDGGFRIWQWKEGQSSKTWTAVANWVVEERQTQCTAFGTCGQYSLCQMSTPGSLSRVQCTCPKGFKPLYGNDAARGCTPVVIVNKPDCNDTTKVKLLELGQTDMPWGGDYRNLNGSNSTNCRDECLKDCDCAGAVYSSEEQHCWMKNAPLYNLGYPTVALHGTDRTAYIKISINQPPEPSDAHEKANVGVILGPVLGGVLVIGVGIFCALRRRESLHRICGGLWGKETRSDDIPDFTGPYDAPPALLEGSSRREQRNN